MPNELTPEEKKAKQQAFLALDVKNADFSTLPAAQTPPPGLSDNDWQKLAREILYLNQRLLSNALTEDDAKALTKINNTIKATQKEYNASLKKTVNQYKEILTNALNAIGYQNIFDFIEEKNTKQRAVQAERVAHNRQMLHEAVDTALEKAPHIKHDTFKNSLETLFLQAFPDVNSKAKNKLIEGQKLVALQAVVTQTISLLDDTFEKYPVINQLPSFSETIRQLSTLVSALSTDTSKITSWLQADQDTIIDLKLKEETKDPLKAIAFIKEELNDIETAKDAEVALEHIKRIVLSRNA